LIVTNITRTKLIVRCSLTAIFSDCIYDHIRLDLRLQIMKLSFTIFILLLLSLPLCAQDNYEIQVYGSETMDPRTTMFELHSNVTTMGFRQDQNGVIADDLAWHETIEVTHGFTSWFEVGAYLFMSANRGQYGLTYVGDHIRPRFRAPVQWHWPVGVSLSLEVGYQKPRYCADIWTLEIRPIIDKEYKWFYVAFNPVLDYSIQGLNHHAGLQFAPDVKVKFQVSKKVGLGLEYYSGVGSIQSPYILSQQSHQIGPACDLDVSPDYEINFGYMFGLTPGTERGIVKLILGRKVGWGKKKK